MYGDFKMWCISFERHFFLRSMTPRIKDFVHDFQNIKFYHMYKKNNKDSNKEGKIVVEWM